jgi:predicted PurR-regulated permease PerM
VAAAHEFERAAWRVVYRGVFLVFGLALAAWLLVQLREVVVQLVLAIILAAGMTPLVNRISQRQWVGIGRRSIKPPRGVAVLLLYLALSGLVALVGLAVVPPLAADVEDLVRSLPAYGLAIQRWAAGLPARYPFLPALPDMQGAASQLQAGAAQLAGVLGQALVVAQVVLGVVGGALDGLFVLILALYFTADGGRLLRYFLGFLPPQRQPQAEGVANRIGLRLGGWVQGQIALSAIIGAATLVGLWAIGVPYAVLLALVAALGETVPMIGPIFSAVPAVIVAFFQSPLQGFLTLGLYVVIQQLENSVIVPRVMSRAVALNPLAVIVALLAGAQLMGITGAILSVPVAAALAVVLDEVRRERCSPLSSARL